MARARHKPSRGSAPGREVVILCPAGLEPLVRHAAEADLALRVIRQGGGCLVGTTSASASELRAFPCATNVFVVAATCRSAPLRQVLARLADVVASAPVPAGMPRHGTFRLRIHDEGRFASTSVPEARALEAAVARWSGLRPSPRGGGLEIWVLRRSDLPEAYLASKLTAGNAVAARGALRPEVAAAIARAEPVAGRRVLDPFAGSGALGVAALDAAAAHVWLNDSDMRPTLPRRVPHDRVTVTQVDFREIDPASPFDVVLTDPPWGVFAQPAEGVTALYRDLGAAAAQWLAPGGALVVLTGAPSAAEAALFQGGQFSVEHVFPVLINGKKARLVRARRLNHQGGE